MVTNFPKHFATTLASVLMVKLATVLICTVKKAESAI